MQPYSHEHKSKRVNLVRALIGLEGDVVMQDTTYEKEGGVTLHGFFRKDSEPVKRNFYIGKQELGTLCQANSVAEVMDIYKGIGYFQSV